MEIQFLLEQFSRKLKPIPNFEFLGQGVAAEATRRRTAVKRTLIAQTPAKDKSKLNGDDVNQAKSVPETTDM